MTDLFKDIVKAWEERVQSPFLGSIGIAFVACNWKPIFFLLFSGEPVLDRFAFVDANTNLTSLLFKPVLLGVLLAIAIPWLKLFGAWVAKAPTTRLNDLQGDLASKRRINEFNKAAEEEAAKAKFEARYEQRKIEAAKRLEEAKSVGDEDVVGELLYAREVNSLRDDDDSMLSILANQITAAHKAALLVIGDVDSGGISTSKIAGSSAFKNGVSKTIHNPSSTRLEVEVRASLDWLKEQGLATYNTFDDRWFLTKKGYDLFDQCKNTD